MFIKETFDVRKQFVIIDLKSGGVSPFPACVQKIALNLETPYDLVEEVKLGGRNYATKFFSVLEKDTECFGVTERPVMQLQNVRYGAAANTTYGGQLPEVLELAGIQFGWCEYLDLYTPIKHVGDVEVSGIDTLLLGSYGDAPRVEYGETMDEFEVTTPLCDLKVEDVAKIQTGTRTCVVRLNEQLYLAEMQASALATRLTDQELQYYLNTHLNPHGLEVVEFVGFTFLSYPQKLSEGVFSVELLNRPMSNKVVSTGYSWEVRVQNRRVVSVIPQFENGVKITAQVSRRIEHFMAMLGLVNHSHDTGEPTNSISAEHKHLH